MPVVCRVLLKGKLQVPAKSPVWRARARKFQIAVSVAALVFAGSFSHTRGLKPEEFDLPVTRWIQQWQTGWLDKMMDGVSQLGFPPWAPAIVVGSMIVMFALGLRWEAGALLFAGLGIGLFNKLGKKFVEIPRPTEDLVRVVTPITDFSFPSGHVLLIVAFGGFVMFLVYTTAQRAWVRRSVWMIFALATSVVGVARIYMGHHWSSDVIGAYMLGCLLLTVTIFVYRKAIGAFLPARADVVD